MNRGNRPAVTSIQQLQQVKGLAAPDFAQNDPVGPVSQGSSQEVSDGYRGHSVLLTARLEANDVVFLHLNFSGVFDQNHAFMIWNKLG